jgi:hypothetical protein
MKTYGLPNKRLKKIHDPDRCSICGENEGLNKKRARRKAKEQIKEDLNDKV